MMILQHPLPEANLKWEATELSQHHVNCYRLPDTQQAFQKAHLQAPSAAPHLASAPQIQQPQLRMGSTKVSNSLQ